VQHGQTVANLPKAVSMDEIALAEALTLLAEKGKVLKPMRGAKKGGAKKPAAPKAAAPVAVAAAKAPAVKKMAKPKAKVTAKKKA
jgi:DNA topoisomerase-1